MFYDAMDEKLTQRSDIQRVIYQKPGGPKETRTEFFERVANGTRTHAAVEREEYVLSRWGSLGSSWPDERAPEGGS